jgi:hypothetical protein
VNPRETAYLLQDYRYKSPPNNSSFDDKFDTLIKQPRASEIEGLFFGKCSRGTYGVLALDKRYQ